MVRLVEFRKAERRFYEWYIDGRSSGLKTRNFDVRTGLPDGLFSNQKSQFGKILEGLILENVVPFGIFYGHLGYFMTIWYTLCSFGTFFPVLVSCTKKNLATLRTYVQPKNCKCFFRYATKLRFLNMPLRADISGVDVIITIFCDFRQFSAKMAFFLKTDAVTNFLHTTELF
jgi:hypothetical protein